MTLILGIIDRLIICFFYFIRAIGVISGKYFLLLPQKNGVSDGVRTRDFQGHNLTLCQLSYTHRQMRTIIGKRPKIASQINPNFAFCL
jgi:hypothetical protein